MHNPTEKQMIVASLAERLIFTKFFETRNDFQIISMSKVISNDSWDIKILSGNTQYLIECKIRKSPKKLYAGWVIQ